MTLRKTLEENHRYPMHMPGHKRNAALCHLGDPYALDVTEIQGMDNLMHPQGVLKTLTEEVEELYGASTHLLVNGSTGGLLAGITAMVSPGQVVLVARNSHKAVYNGLLLAGAKVIWLYPNRIPGTDILGGITGQQVEEALKAHPEISGVILTSPTYEGIVSQVEEIAALTRKAGIPLLVDEAHGAHFGLAPGYPASAVSQGADLVIHSFHKMLPCLNQTGAIHCQGPFLSSGRVKEKVNLFQTTSPSYVLLASIEEGIGIAKKQGRELLTKALPLLTAMEGKELAGILKDPSKVILFGKGPEILALAREKYQMELEMAAPGYAIALTTMGDTKEALEQLQKLQEETRKMFPQEILTSRENVPKAVSLCTLGEADRMAKELCPEEAALGKTAGDYVYLYPPGIPLLAPGEEITKEVLETMKEWRKAGFSVQGPIEPGMLQVGRKGEEP